MRPGARIQAAIEVLGDIAERRRPATDALKDWGLAHRFAGSGDRAAIADLVYDTLRRRASIAWAMGTDAPRALVLGHLALVRGESAQSLTALFEGDRHAPAAPSEEEAAALARVPDGEAPAHVAGDFPQWLAPALGEAFGETLLVEMCAMTARAPLDLRANTLKAAREKVAKALASFGAAPAPLAPQAVRIPAPAPGRKPAHVQSEPGFSKGWFEVQDEGSQLAAALVDAHAGMQVADICAGGGGKTLALAAAMQGRGQVHAYDSDKRRLAPIFERLRRAGAHNAQVLPPAPAALADLAGRMDRVLVDAPCTGTGTWRRNPDAKWRLRPGALEARLAEQSTALDAAAPLVRPGGRLVYVTCSLLPAENDGQVGAFLARVPGFRPLDALGLWREVLAAAPPDGLAAAHGLQLTPARAGTDGFYIAVLERTE